MDRSLFGYGNGATQDAENRRFMGRGGNDDVTWPGDEDDRGQIRLVYPRSEPAGQQDDRLTGSAALHERCFA